MPYTWTGVSAFGFDLVRLAGGPAIAGVVLDGLAADAPYVRSLAAAGALSGATAAAASSARAEALALVSASQSTVLDLREAVGAVVPEPARDVSPAERLTALVTAVEVHRFGGPQDVADLLHDVAAAWEATEAERAGALGVLRDALLAAYVPTAAVLAQAYRAAGPAPEPGFGPCAQVVRDLLSGVLAGGVAGDPLDLLREPRYDPARMSWAAAMHEASWAAELTGRTMAAAAAQLAAVRAVRGAGYTAEQCARTAWNTLSGRVAAAVVADVLAGPAHDALAG